MTTHAEVERRGRRGGVLGVAVAVLLAPAAWAAPPRAPAGEPLPDPNGYDDLVAAGKAVTGNFIKVVDLVKADPDELRVLVAVNAEALARARVGLGRESVVTLAKAASIETSMNDLGALRNLGRLLACEAALAEREGRWVEAAGGYAGVIRLGRSASSGGLIIARLGEGAVQYAGVDGLYRLAPSLAAGDACRFAADVERLDRDREPLSRVFDRDLAFSLDRGGLSLRLAYSVNAKAMQDLLAPAKAAAVQADKRAQARLRLLAASLALRAYRLDHPDAPAPPDLGALVPAYLKDVPADPFGEGPLKLKVQNGEARVYSVGPDGRDDGGAPSAPANPKDGDVTLGAP